MFVVHVRAGSTYAWVVKARYSQFRAFRSVVKREVPGLPFPGKLFKGGMSRADWERRRCELGQYMRELLHIERTRAPLSLSSRFALYSFLRVPADCPLRVQLSREAGIVRPRDGRGAALACVDSGSGAAARHAGAGARRSSVDGYAAGSARAGATAATAACATSGSSGGAAAAPSKPLRGGGGARRPRSSSFPFARMRIADDEEDDEEDALILAGANGEGSFGGSAVIRGGDTDTSGPRVAEIVRVLSPCPESVARNALLACGGDVEEAIMCITNARHAVVSALMGRGFDFEDVEAAMEACGHDEARAESMLRQQQEQGEDGGSGEEQGQENGEEGRGVPRLLVTTGAAIPLDAELALGISADTIPVGIPVTPGGTHDASASLLPSFSSSSLWSAAAPPLHQAGGPFQEGIGMLQRATSAEALLAALQQLEAAVCAPRPVDGAATAAARTLLIRTAGRRHAVLSGAAHDGSRAGGAAAAAVAEDALAWDDRVSRQYGRVLGYFSAALDEGGSKRMQGSMVAGWDDGSASEGSDQDGGDEDEAKMQVATSQLSTSWPSHSAGALMLLSQRPAPQRGRAQAQSKLEGERQRSSSPPPSYLSAVGDSPPCASAPPAEHMRMLPQ